MHEGRILHCEPDASWTNILEHAIRDTNHSVVDSAHTQRDSLAALDRIASNALDVNLVVMSATINPEAIIRRIHELRLPVRTMLLSGQPNAAESVGVEVDAEVFKPTWETIPAAIDALQEAAVRPGLSER